MTTSSAPGKIILFGEHAVVYGRPALAVPVTQVHADVEVSDSNRAGIWIEAPDVNLHAELNTLPSDHPLASVINRFLPHPNPSPNLGRRDRGEGLQIKITSTIPVASGLGSGAAVSVALTRALSAHLDHQMTDEEVNAFVFEIEKIHHGTPSGIDNTVVTYAKPVYFEKGKPIEILKVGHPFTIVIADTGIPAPTKTSVSDVRHLWLNNKSYWETVFDKVGHVSFMARRAIEAGNSALRNVEVWRILGELMNENHQLLQEMKVSSPVLDKLVSAAISAGALGAKLSGGGRGGNMIALVENEKAETIARALEAAGAQHTIITQVV